MTKALGEFEILLLLAVTRLGDEAYGAAVLREIERRTEREPSSGAVYTGLDRLESKGFLSSRVGDPTPERGGRRKRFYVLEPPGARALAESIQAIGAMARGVEPEVRALAREVTP